MTAAELRNCLSRLGLTQTEAAELLSVAPRTVRRWADISANEIPGPVEQALRAWLGLHRLGLPWRPGEVDVEQIARYREHAIELYDLLLRVERRGGPRAPWQVNIDKGEATLGPMRLSFYKLTNGGFAPGFYRRSDQHPDVTRDWPLIEDAFACIAKALAEARRGRFVFAVTLQNGSVLLWDVQRVPTVVMKISCSLIRTVLCRDETIADEQCRLVVDCNKELMSELADSIYTRGRITVREDRIQVLEATSTDLATVADRFSTSVLRVVPYWPSAEVRPMRSARER